jgi:hypothetical protein
MNLKPIFAAAFLLACESAADKVCDAVRMDSSFIGSEVTRCPVFGFRRAGFLQMGPGARHFKEPGKCLTAHITA